MRSYYFKNFILASSLVLLSFVILGASFFALGRNLMLAERRDRIEANVAELSRLSSAYAQDGALTDWEFRIVLSALSQSTGNHSFITTTEGLVVTCSDPDFACPHLSRTISPTVMKSLNRDGAYRGITALDGFYAQSHYVSALPITGRGGYTVGYIFAGTNTADIFTSWGQLMRIYLLSALTIMVIALMFSFLASKRQAKPIHEMAAAAVKFAHGDFSVRVSGEEREDEIGALAASFNQMADSLSRSEKRRSEFLANVAHELKTPMTSISGFADGILDGTIPPEEQGRYLETISSETKRLNRLVRHMLDASRMQESGGPELHDKSFNARELLVQTLLVFESKINAKELDVNVLIPEDDLIVLGDADAINQVIYNLLENAVKFSPQGGELGLSLFKQGSKAYISIRNQSETIPEAELASIFDRFHKTDKSRSMDRDGVGLGLYIVKNILGSHGEDIAVTSRDGVTEFVFSLTLKGK